MAQPGIPMEAQASCWYCPQGWVVKSTLTRSFTYPERSVEVEQLLARADRKRNCHMAARHWSFLAAVPAACAAMLVLTVIALGHRSLLAVFIVGVFCVAVGVAGTRSELRTLARKRAMIAGSRDRRGRRPQ